MPSCFWTAASAGQFRADSPPTWRRLLGEFETVGIGVGDDDEARAGVTRHGGGHDADGARAGDEDILAEHGKASTRYARRCRRDRRWRRHRGQWPVVMPDVGHGQRRGYSANAPGRLTPTPLVSAQRWRRPARQLRQRPQTTWPSPLTMSPGKKSFDVGADFDDFANEFVADRHGHGDGFLRPNVPFIDVEVGAADAGAVDLDEDVIDADRRGGEFLQARGPFRICF